MISEKEWKWFGQAGHFICGQWCRFHLCTHIGKYFVSTVGKFVHPRHSGGSEMKELEYLEKNPDGETIGTQRHYETMVFRAGPACKVKGCACGQPTIKSDEIAFKAYNDARSATVGHLEMCRLVASGKVKR